MEKINEKLVKKIHRSSPDIIDRSKYLRLDKNERVVVFEKKFLEFLKEKIDTLIYLHIQIPIKSKNLLLKN